MFREMLKKDRQLSEGECAEILRTETRGVLSVLGDGGYPYGMPMNHFYDERDGKIYFHSGKKGHRTDAVLSNNKVSFCVYERGVRPEGEWAFTVRSVIVFGRMEIIDDIEKITDITTRLSHKFTKDDEYIRNEIKQYAAKTALLVLTPEHICGKTVTEA